MNALRMWLAALAALALTVAFSARYLDRPIALLAHRDLGGLSFWRVFGRTPSLFIPVGIALLALFAARRLLQRPFNDADVALILCEIATIATKLILAPLKILFGRNWPLYHHPSFLRDGAYGFHFLHVGAGFESFPSGHAASVCAIAGVLWFCYPRLRPLYAVGVVAVGAALVAGTYHFLADVLAGGFLGASVAIATMAAWRRSSFARPRA